MSAQEEMLEYALFDLSTFVRPVVVPTLSIAFNPSPLIVKQNETSDQVTINVTNTSTNTEIDPSATLSLTLPDGLTATEIGDSTKGWNCTLNTLKCTRTTSIGSTVSDSITMTVSVSAYPPGGLASSTSLLKATVSSPTFSNDVTATDTVIFQQKPRISWPTPAPIIYGTALSGSQLDAKSTIPGTFIYTPANGTVLSVGQRTLTAVFTPTDDSDFTPATATVMLTVVPATPVVAVAPTPNPAFLSNAVTITASIPSPASAPGGTVAFYDGGMQLGSSTLNGGSASLTTSALGMGTHAITAVYSGDANYHSSSSPAMMETIQDFAIAVTPGSSSGTPTVFPGTPASYSFVVSPVGGSTLAGALALSADGMPANATVVFSPSVVAANSGTTSITMVVKTPSLAAVNPASNPLGKGALPMALGLVLVPFARRLRKARRWIQVLALSIAGAAFSLGATGCGGFTYTPQSFSVTVTAKSGNLSHATAVKLKVE